MTKQWWKAAGIRAIKTIAQSAKTRLGADYGSDHELLIAKFDLN